jgi:hypothetical protein
MGGAYSTHESEKYAYNVLERKNMEERTTVKS